MEPYVWTILSVGLATIVGLIGVVYRTLVAKIEEISKMSDRGLNLKVDKAEYKIIREWEKEVFDGMKLSVKELKDENNIAHQAIMVEIKKVNDNNKK